MNAAVFPGQGAQYVGMSRTLVQEFPFTKEIFEEASDSISVNLIRLCSDGPEDTLKLTAFAQPAILTTSYAWFRVLEEEAGFRPQAVAGHSLGEYSALVAAGALTLAEAVPLVRTRGTLMQEAVPVGVGGMAAILGLEDERVEKLCAAVSTPKELVVPANYNSPGQIVVSGHQSAIVTLKAKGAEAPWKARKVVELAVSAPFHSPLMSTIREKFREHLAQVAWKKPSVPIAWNVDAEIKDHCDPIDLLVDQLDHPVRWTQCVTALWDYGVRTFVEPGPGRVLTGLIKRTQSEAQLWSIESVDELQKLRKELAH